jgi:hypothetical protein
MARTVCASSYKPLRLSFNVIEFFNFAGPFSGTFGTRKVFAPPNFLVGLFIMPSFPSPSYSEKIKQGFAICHSYVWTPKMPLVFTG